MQGSPRDGAPDVMDTWRLIVENMSELRRVAYAMAAADRRLDRDDLLQDSIADIIEAGPRLYDPDRGAWLVWARTRMRKTRIYHLRRLKPHPDVVVTTTGGRDADTTHMEPVLPVGSAGHAARMESSLALRQVAAIASEEELDAILVLAHGMDPERIGGRHRLRSLVNAVRDRVMG